MAVIYKAKESFTLGSGNLKLSVEIGNGQKANTLVTLDDNIIVWGVISEITIDTVENCKNKKLYLEVNATDTNSNTDTVPVTIDLHDDSEEETYEYEEDADKNGGTVIFEITINLK
jgi:Tfp pilus assembly major pilin PilA